MRPALAAAATLLLLAGFPTWAGASRAERVYIATERCRDGAGPYAYEPHRITLYCGSAAYPYATGIVYMNYGQNVATATATIWDSACNLGCGVIRGYPGTLRFSGIVRCQDGRLYYGRTTFKYAKGTGYTVSGEGCQPQHR